MSLSSFALEPAYLSLRLIEAGLERKFKTRIIKLHKAYPVGKNYVNYSIKAAKLELLWDMFLESKGAGSLDFKNFAAHNAYWLDDFALFKVAKFVFSERAWYDWPVELKDRYPEAVERFKRDNARALNFHKWLQWQAFKQFGDLKNYAAAKKVLIKGDLPVLVSRDSADVWAMRRFFKMDLAAGAPPDMYCAKGQRWGMPTYDWPAIADDGYRYIKAKLNYARNFYDLIRIDHVVGLFRIWSIPVFDSLDAAGLHGKFDSSDEAQWGPQGRDILSAMLKASDMLLCAEDLGAVPPVCTQTLFSFGMPGNDVQRWTKDWKVRHDWLDKNEYRNLAVTMLSTHDTTNWPAWWENEAGTIDEPLFMAKCADRKINYGSVRDRLFDLSRSGYGRLRWRADIASVNELAAILDKPREQIKDFIEMYENTYKEKEKLFKLLGTKGKFTEKADTKIIAAAMDFNLKTNAIYAIQLFVDWLAFCGKLNGDPYQYRINRPGTISEKNWSLVSPVSLEELLENKHNAVIKKMIVVAGRI